MIGAKPRAFIAVLGAVAAIGAGSAPAWASPAQSATGDLSSGPFHIQFTAHRAADSPADSATGNFVAHTVIGSVSLMSVQGPVTCLDVRGNRAGLFYPIKSGNPAILSMLYSGVFIYVQRSSSGKPQSIGFLPVPYSHTSSCAPSLAPFPVTSGTLTLTS